jgi:ligand-binding sensor domain-containing protein
VQYSSGLVRSLSRLRDRFLPGRFTHQQFFIVLVVLPLILILLHPCPVSAQRYHIRIYSEGDGLPSTAVKGIAQDNSGRMWFATRSGVSTYDGVKWETYGLKDGLPTLDQRFILVDHKGILWALSSEDELAVFEDGRWRFQVELPRGNLLGDQHSLMAAARSDDSSVIVIMLKNRGLYCFRENRLEVLAENTPMVMSGFYGLEVVDNDIILATSEGLMSVPGDSLENEFKHVEGSPREIILGLSYDHHAELLWLLKTIGTSKGLRG